VRRRVVPDRAFRGGCGGTCCGSTAQHISLPNHHTAASTSGPRGALLAAERASSRLAARFRWLSGV
jgi:hypothetical protein